jgi:short-subunit dehydrogenase
MTKQSINNKRLVIISGASRGLGKTFADHYRAEKDTEVIGIGRSKRPGLTLLDLLDDAAVNKFVSQLDIDQFSDIIYMHSVGIDKFEPDGKPHIDLDGDGIDDEVYASNVTACLNLAEPLVDKIRSTSKSMTIVQIGAIGDIYCVPYWQSFTKSKNVIRRYLKSITVKNVRGITLNVSSTLDEDNNKFGRVNADTSYWQTSKELVAKSVGTIDTMKTLDSRYLEVDFYKHDPNFKSDYFTNLPKLFASWQRDLGLVGKDVPHGIRI